MSEIENPIIMAKKISKTLTSESKEKKDKSNKKRKSSPTSNSPSSKDIHPSDESRDDETEQQPSTNRETTNSVNKIPTIRPSKKRKVIPDEIEVDITAPEPPSKKELRLKKKKSLPSTKLGLDLAVHNHVKTKELSSKKRFDYGIWIGNLAYQVSTNEIHKFLVDNSEISDEMITRIIMPEMHVIKSTQKAISKDEKKVSNKGFAYVDFSCIEAVSLAIALSEKLLHGRRLLIKDKKSFEGRPKKLKPESEKNDEPQTKRIFLGNLSFDTTEEDLKENFEKCGPIKSLKIATFEDSGKCKGFAWIVFEEFQAAKDAVRGFILSSDNIDESNSESTSQEDHSKSSSFKPKVKGLQRKLWVNRIKGRKLRVEFAEDAQLRYKKRYGKDGTKNLGDTAKVIQGSIVGDRVKPLKKVEYRQEYAPRLTGGIIESQGKKTTF